MPKKLESWRLPTNTWPRESNEPAGICDSSSPASLWPGYEPFVDVWLQRRVRNFRPFLEKFRKARPGRLRLSAPKALGAYEIPPKVLVAPFLRPCSIEYHVFRAALVSIVLTLAVGPNASLLCKVWCDQHAPAKGCHHRDSGSTSPHVATSTTCDNVAPGVSAFLKEDAAGSASASNGDHALEVPRYRLAASAVDAHPDHEPEYEWGLEKRPLVTALRL